MRQPPDFDGTNAVQELSGSTATANLISGSIDELFTRADSTGSFTPLTDALGSTIALVDASGNLVTQYAYDPFGNTSVSGPTNSNGLQYTGRENEGNGLYYYRARYYSPALHRFISEDPLGFRGSGPNWYAYAYNNPTNLVDPSGMAALLGPDGKECASIRACNLARRKAAIKSWIARMNYLCDANELICPYGIMGPVFAGPGALSANAMNGNIIFIGGGLFVDGASGLAAGGATDLEAEVVPKPPGWDPNWEWRHPEGEGLSSPRWFDQDGGEWRYHSVDPHHSIPHWDYNPWSSWNSSWQNIYWDGKSYTSF